MLHTDSIYQPPHVSIKEYLLLIENCRNNWKTSVTCKLLIWLPSKTILLDMVFIWIILARNGFLRMQLQYLRLFTDLSLWHRKPHLLNILCNLYIIIYALFCTYILLLTPVLYCSVCCFVCTEKKLSPSEIKL